MRRRTARIRLQWLAGAIVLALVGFGATTAHAERFAVLIGNNAGGRGNVDLLYAESDARKVQEVLKDLGGFKPENIVVVEGESAATVRRALIAMNDRIRTQPGSAGNAFLFVYYSGHADAEALKLGASRLEHAEVEQLVRGSSAGFRMLVVDACRSGTLTRVKGGVRAPPIAVRLEHRLLGEGLVLLTSSSATEDAQESDEIKGSFFTHYLVSGLLGAADADHDGQVSLGEAYGYAYDHTVRETSRTLAGLQHPTFRYELKGQGDVVLTSPLQATTKRALVSFPEGRAYIVLRGGPEGAVVAEVGARDEVRRISLSAGRYLVRGRASDSLLEGTISLVAGDDKKVDDSQLHRTEYARLVRKGMGEVGLAHGPLAGGRSRTSLWQGASLCSGGYVGYALEWSQLSLLSRVGFCRGSFENATLAATTDEIDLELRVSHAWDLRHVTFDLAATGGAALLRQSFMTRGVAPPRDTLAWQLGVGAGVWRELPRGTYLLLDVVAQTYLFRERNAAGEDESAASFTVRASLGVGIHW